MLRVAVFSLSSFIYNAYDFMRLVIQQEKKNGRGRPVFVKTTPDKSPRHPP